MDITKYHYLKIQQGLQGMQKVVDEPHSSENAINILQHQYILLQLTIGTMHQKLGVDFNVAFLLMFPSFFWGLPGKFFYPYNYLQADCVFFVIYKRYTHTHTHISSTKTSHIFHLSSEK